MMLELDPDTVLDRKLRQMCKENPKIARAFTGREEAEDFKDSSNGRKGDLV